MSGYEDGVPGYLTFRVAPQDGPIAAFAEQEAWQARELYPDILGLALAEYFWAKELDTGGWELSKFPSDVPQGARESLGHHFRMRSVAAQEAGDTKAAEVWMAAGIRMDYEVIDEIRVRGERFRIVRASRFLRTGPNGPEPPRPSDPDPGEIGEGRDFPSRTEGFVVDPHTSTGLSEGLLRLDLLRFVGAVPGSPPGVRRDALRAAEEYPGGVLLPAVFMISERVDGQWTAFHPGSSDATPQGARDGLTTWLRVMAPFTLRMTEEQKAEFARAADVFDEKRRNNLIVDGRRFRVVRVERLMRVGPDGPEKPRPSDFDPEPPVSAHTDQLQEQGLLDLDDEDEPTDPRIERQVNEFQALWERELARRTAAKELREQKRRGATGKTDV
ncbi:DUF5954 family protein [Streptomyces sp. NPDC091279]|uniref:DUF5954 family protein n=1 Tax=unclassified Streptomyces TaxID=2593676 RepID=UPI00382A10F9